jgi:hypothetical protein
MSEDIKIDFTPSSEDNPDRMELLWESREEDLLLEWGAICKSKSIQHDTQGKTNKMRFGVFGVPSVLIPIVLGGLSSVAPSNSLIYSLGMMGSGLFSGVNMFFNFSKKAQQHFEYSGKFAELATEIETELCKPKKHRIACDIYLERIKISFNALCSQSPPL